jgi:hypothetical protein
MQNDVRIDLAYGEDALLGRREQAILARAAARRACHGVAQASRALQALGYLEVRRMRITPPFNSPLRARIS